MTTTLKEQAWQSGLVLLNKTPEWNEDDWPPLEGGWRSLHATVVLHHPNKNDDNNNRRQTVVVMGGRQQGKGTTDSVLVLNLSDPDKQWQQGPPMNKKRDEHAAVVCNGGVYAMGGYDEGSFDSIERIDADDMLHSSLTSSTTRASNWKRLTCRLSTGRVGCCTVAVQNRYIVVMGGYYSNRYLSSVDIIDANNHIVTAGPSMTVSRSYFGSAVVGHRIFVIGGRNNNGNLDSLEYLDYATPFDSDETKNEIGSTFISSSTWITHSDLVLSSARSPCAMVAVGSCLVVAGGGWHNSTMEVLDTHHNCVWNLPQFGKYRVGCNMVPVANEVAVIGGWRNPSCVTLPLMDKNTWCFRRLCEQPRNEWHEFREGMGIRNNQGPREAQHMSLR